MDADLVGYLDKGEMTDLGPLPSLPVGGMRGIPYSIRSRVPSGFLERKKHNTIAIRYLYIITAIISQYLDLELLN